MFHSGSSDTLERCSGQFRKYGRIKLMKLKNFSLVDGTGRKVVVIAADEKSAARSWEYANPGVNVISVTEELPC